MIPQKVIANRQPIAAKLPCMLEEFLGAQQLLPRSVVVDYALAMRRGGVSLCA